MALARCEVCGQPSGLRCEYVWQVLPLGYPNSHLVCGAPNCAKPAVVWLTALEGEQYTHGQRAFQLPRRANKVHLTNHARKPAARIDVEA